MKAFNSKGGKLWQLLLPMLAFILFSVNPTFAAHDECTGAIALSCGDVITGNNSGATDDDVPSCGQQSLGHGLWYTIDGTGGDVTVSTCNPGTNFDTQLSIYTGGCDGLACYANNNNSGACANVRASIVTFPTEVGTTYYILIGGALGSRGDFEMSVSCATPDPSNDDCEDAIAIGCNENAFGTTTGASNDDSPSFCGTSLGAGPGVWYVFQGTGDDIRVSTCNPGTNFDTKLGVFSGSCDDLDCVGGNDDQGGGSDPACFSTGSSFNRASTVEFSSEAGTTYYIYVTGFSSNNGEYELSLTCTPPDVTPDNDMCVDAIELDCDSSVMGTTNGSNPASVAFCGTSLTSSGGVWYSVMGTGGEITASTCNPGTNYDTKLGVFSGACNALVCVGGNDDQSGGTDPACVVDATGSSFNRASTVTWQSTEGTMYFILVTGFSTNEGDFELSLECEDVDPGGGGGDDPDPLGCADAIEIECGDVVTGDTELGMVNTFAMCNGENVSTAPGVFYIIEGSGDNELITVSTCSSVTNYDSKIAVFSGSCDDLVCVSANNNDSNCSTGLGVRNATVSFAAMAGETYYVYVTGQLGSNGIFELSVECGASNDDCVDALPIACGETVSGSTSDATADAGVPFCGTTVAGRRGVWYEMTGTGTDLTATTCNAGTNFDTKLAVFTGSCGDLVCVGGDDDDPSCGFSSLRSTVDFFALEEVTYYILVTGFGTTSSGNFELSINGVCEPDGGPIDQDGINDDVCDADDLIINQSYGFSNVNSTAQPGEPNPGPGTGPSTCNSSDGWCSFELDVDNSNWFKFVAPASGCINAGANTIDYQIAIWSVGDCNDFGTFTEVAANDDSGPGLSPFVENVAVTPGETYYVQVDGYNGATSASGLVLVQDCGTGTLIAQQNNSSLIGTPAQDGWAISEVFPNPTAGAPVSLDLNAPRDVPAEIYLMDQLGRVLTTQQQAIFQGSNRIQVAMDNLAPGMYFISIRAGEETFHKKVMLVRP